MEELISKTMKISYADNRLELPPSQTNPTRGFSLLGKILSARVLNGSVVQEIVLKAWNPKSGLKVTPVGRNLFTFVFEQEEDMLSAFNKRP